MSTTELMQLGRQQVKETDAALLRSEKIVNDTMAIGIQTAETLQAQTRQLEKVCRRNHSMWHGAATLVCFGTVFGAAPIPGPTALCVHPHPTDR